MFSFLSWRAVKISSEIQIIGIRAAATLRKKHNKENFMATAQPDKTGMHILLKLASLVIILAGIHAAAEYYCTTLTGALFRHRS